MVWPTTIRTLHRLFILSALMLICFSMPHPVFAQGGYIVNNAGDVADPDVGTAKDDNACDTAFTDNQGNPVNNNTCTLRAAIQNANERGGGSITFAGGMTIFPASVLPRVLVPISIDGGGQVTLDAGNGVGGGDQIFDPTALKLVAPGSTVRGMNFVRWSTGILLSGGTFNGVTMNANDTLITDNSFGGDPNTTAAPGNGYGIFVTTNNNIIQSNNFTGNRTGVYLIFGTGNTVQSNTITYNGVQGPIFGGNQFIITGQDGVLIVDSTYNTVVDNTIAGNGRAGVWIQSYNSSTHHHTVRSNRIGVDESGTIAIPNGQYGVYVGGDDNTIGGPTVEDGNLISGNQGPGLYVANNRNVIQHNRIGVDASGNLAIPNTGDGILVQPSGGGNAHTILQNQIGGNGGDGIDIGPGEEPALIYGNLIGVNAEGTSALPNGGNGINAGFTGKLIIGGPGANQGNLISGNRGHGIVTSGGNRTIVGNRIGVNGSVTASLRNEGDGIRLNDTGSAVVRGNIIGGNGGDGIYQAAFNNSGNQITGNFIGTNPERTLNLGNSDDGIHIQGGSPRIGGPSAAEGNVIAHNGALGIRVERSDGNQLRGNALYNNSGLGIDLGDNGVDRNDLNDADINLTNDGQNYPVLVSATSGQATIEGTFFGTANQNFALDFFQSSHCDPSGNGEGEFYLGTLTVTTDNRGYANFTFQSTTTVPVGAFVTATATNTSSNNSSELSTCLPVPTLGNLVRWNNPNGGNWNNPSNWSPQVVPQLPHNVVIDLAGDYVVNLDTDAVINSLTLGGSSGTQQFLMAYNGFGGYGLTLNAPSTIATNGLLSLQDGGFFDNGGLINHSMLTVNGRLAWSGGRARGSGEVLIANGGTLAVSGGTLDGLTLTNQGEATLGESGFSTGLFTEHNPTINNRGLFLLHGNLRTNPPGAPTTAQFNNSGTLRLDGFNLSLEMAPQVNNSGLVEVGNNSSLTFSSGYTQSAGELRVDNGTIYRNSFGTADLVINGGLVTGNGNLFANVVNNGGTLSPGQSPGRLTLRGLVQGAGGTLNIELAGRNSGSFSTQFDVIDSTFSTVSLGGTLNISRIDGFSSVEGESFRIIRADTVTGQFATVNGPDLGNGGTYQVNYQPAQVTLSHGPEAPAAMDLAIGLNPSAYQLDPNSQLTYAINVSNYQPGGGGGINLANRGATVAAASAETNSSQNVVVTLALPTGVTFASASTTQGECTGPAVGATGTISCALGEVFQSFEGPSVYITINALVTATNGELTATAEVTSTTPDSDLSNNQATTVVSVNGVEPTATPVTPTATATPLPTMTPTPAPQTGVLTIELVSQPKSRRNFRFESRAPIGHFLLDDSVPSDGDNVPSSRSFTLRAGPYTVAQVVPAGWFLTALTCTEGAAVTVDLANRQVTAQVQAGETVSCTFVNQQAGIVRATLFHDQNRNGTRQSREPWNQGWTVNLLNSQNTVIATQTTYVLGKASFINVRPGTYTLCEVLQGGLTHPQPCQPITVAPAAIVSLTYANRTPAVTGASSDSPATALTTTVQPEALTGDEEASISPTDERWLTQAAPTGLEESEVRARLFLPLVTR